MTPEISIYLVAQIARQRERELLAAVAANEARRARRAEKKRRRARRTD